jgi:ATP phosphoribosyltransferase
MIPSRGRIGDLATDFLTACGMSVLRPNPKQYVALVPSMADVRVHMQRAADIIDQISQGNADIGITGYDLFLEHRSEGGDVFVIRDDLGFSHARLEIAVPDSWVDVAHIDDLAELALNFRHEGRDLRVATSYPNLVREFLLRQSIHNFALIEAGGSVEAAPGMGSADVIADIVQTGTALIENRLKTVASGTILDSKACLVGCTRTLKSSRSKLALTRRVLELFDAYLDGSDAFTLTANVAGKSEKQIAGLVLDESELAGVEGPTVSKLYSKSANASGSWYAVNVTVRSESLLAAVDHFRSIGASSVIARPATYVFHESSASYRKLIKALGIEP